MIDKAIYEHLVSDPELSPLLTVYDDKPSVFNQEAPPDTDTLWAKGAQYSRIIFALDIQGDPARTIEGSLSLDIQCAAGKQFPEELEPVVRKLIDGYFFSDEGCTMEAQWIDTRYFTEPAHQVSGVTLAFTLLAFPMLGGNITKRLNEWTSERFPELLVLNRDSLPSAWKPSAEKKAVYWRMASTRPARWIPDTYQTVWRTATFYGHVFAPDIETVEEISQAITMKLYSDRRLVKRGESQIMVDRNNSYDAGADALRMGQITVEATYGEIVQHQPYNPMNHINYN